jgi:hypothetical protein
VRDVALAYDLDLTDERRAIIARALDGQGFTPEQLEACAHRLMASETLDDKLRYGGTLTPADFVRARKHVARTSTPSTRTPEMRHGDRWMQRVEHEHRTGRIDLTRMVCVTASPGQKALPAPEPDEPEDVPRCPDHDRPLLGGTFCAACEVKQVQAAEAA